VRENTPDARQAKMAERETRRVQVDNARTPVLGTDLPGRIWVRLNIIHTGQGRCTLRS